MNHATFPVHQDADGIVTLTLEDPEASALVLSGKLIRTLDETLTTIEQMDGVTGLVLASGCKRVYIAGANLKEIDALSDDELNAYLEYGSKTFARIAALPYPTVAAIDGAVLGGGLEVAMHCDGLVALRKERPYPVGLPESGLAICPGWGGTQLLPARINPADAIRQTAIGKPMKFDEAEQAGLFNAVVDDADALPTAAKDWLKASANDEPVKQRIASRRPRSIADTQTEQVREALDGDYGDTGSTKAVVDAVRVGLDRGFVEGVASERASLISLRNQPAARERLEAFFNKSK